MLRPEMRTIRQSLRCSVSIPPSPWQRLLLLNASALPDARFRRGVNGGEELCARPVKPFGRGRPWLRRTRALCKFNGGKERCWSARRLCHRAQHLTRWGNLLAAATKYLEKLEAVEPGEEAARPSTHALAHRKEILKLKRL